MEEVKTETPSSSSSPSPSASSLRWAILRNTFLARPPRSSASDNPSAELGGGGAGAGAGKDIISISRRTTAQGFNLIPSRLIQSQQEEEKDCVNLSKTSNSNNKDHVYVSYTLPLHTLVLRQRLDNSISLNDFEICNKYHIDNTGLVLVLSLSLCRSSSSQYRIQKGSWPSEDVLSYFCLSHANMFRSKRVLELGAGYGLAGLVIAASTDAIEVVISDGNPQVVDYIQHNIYANSTAFSGTEVKSMILHWNQEEFSNITNAFDIIVASDCTFFKEFHESLARTIKSSLKHSEASEAILLSPKRGNSLDKFLEKITEVGLHFSVVENYDEEIWQRHQKFVNGDCSWPNYETDHCYPFLRTEVSL